MHELSKQFEKAWIRLADSDGEFLLIEAARALPTWINPEIADNRVWLRPPPSKSTVSGQLTVRRSGLTKAVSSLYRGPRPQPMRLSTCRSPYQGSKL